MNRPDIGHVLSRAEALALCDAGFLPLSRYAAMVANGEFSDSNSAVNATSPDDGHQDCSGHRTAATADASASAFSFRCPAAQRFGLCAGTGRHLATSAD